MKRILGLVTFGVLTMTAAPPSVSAMPGKEALDAAFDEALRRYELPGLAVGIVERGATIYRRVAGELIAGKGDPIDLDSLFKIGSNTKAMTVALLGRLVDSGKLDWRDPVLKHLPDFRMYSDALTYEMQVRDLLIHNSGLGPGAGDLMLWPEPNHFTRSDVLRGLRYLKPLYSFRSQYTYDNLLYIVAGEVAAAVSKATYEELVRREVFEPLGMTRCQIGEWNRDDVANVAQPHLRLDGRNVPVRTDGTIIPAQPMDPAGGIRCSLRDMLTWAAAMLEPRTPAGSTHANKPWLSAQQRDAIWSAQTIMPLPQRLRSWDRSHYLAYGYGWRLTDVDGLGKVFHTGTLAGMYTAVTLLPELDVGIVVLANGGSDEARVVLDEVLIKMFTAPAQNPSIAYYQEKLGRERPSSTASKQDSARTRVRAEELAPYLGRYRDRWFGEVAICVQGDAVRFTSTKSPKLSGELKRVQKRILVQWDDATVEVEAWLMFSQSRGPKAPAILKMRKVDPDGDFSYDFEDLLFERVGACKATRQGTN